MCRLLFIFTLFLIAPSSCAKEELQNAEELALESRLEELKTVQEEIFIRLSPLKQLPPGELQALAAGDDLLRGLKKFEQIDADALEALGERFALAANHALALGSTEKEIFTLLENNARDYRLRNAVEMRNMTRKALSTLNTPCYDDWENTYLGAAAAYALCLLFTGGSGIAQCTVAFGIAILVADALYDRCLSNYQ